MTLKTDKLKSFSKCQKPVKAAGPVLGLRLTVLVPFAWLPHEETDKNKLHSSAWSPASVSAGHFSVPLQTSSMSERKPFYLLNYMKFDFLLVLNEVLLFH